MGGRISGRDSGGTRYYTHRSERDLLDLYILGVSKHRRLSTTWEILSNIGFLNLPSPSTSPHLFRSSRTSLFANASPPTKRELHHAPHIPPDCHISYRNE